MYEGFDLERLTKMIVGEIPTYEIKLTEKQKEDVGYYKLDPTPNENGDYSELVAMKVLREMDCEPKKIPMKYNAEFGDIEIVNKKATKENEYWRRVEVKTGTYFDGKYKATVDTKYTTKESNGKEKYVQKKGLPYPWLFHESYDIFAIVFDDRIYFFEAYPFLDDVYDSISFRTFTFPKQRGMSEEWYKTRRRYFIDLGVEGSIKSPKYWCAETYLANIDLDLFLRLHHIPYKVVKYKIA